MEYKQNGGSVNPIAIRAVDTHSLLNKKVSQAAKACDAADILDGLATLQNPTIRVLAFAYEVWPLSALRAAFRPSSGMRCGRAGGRSSCRVSRRTCRYRQLRRSCSPASCPSSVGSRVRSTSSLRSSATAVTETASDQLTLPRQCGSASFFGRLNHDTELGR
jgi:hypothetical protein